MRPATAHSIPGMSSLKSAPFRVCLSLGWLALVVGVLHPTPAAAHQMPYTAVMLDFGRDGVKILAASCEAFQNLNSVCPLCNCR